MLTERELNERGQNSEHQPGSNTLRAEGGIRSDVISEATLFIGYITSIERRNTAEPQALNRDGAGTKPTRASQEFVYFPPIHTCLFPFL